MKIISGELKGRVIKVGSSLEARPTTSVLKEAIFSILYSKNLIVGAKVLDLFSGTGALVFESLSRGAAQATAVDINRSNLKNIRENIRDLGLENKAETINCDATQLRYKENKYNLVFIDPPYKTNLVELSINHLLTNNFLEDQATIVCEFKKNYKFKINEQLKEVFYRAYGNTILQIFTYKKNTCHDS